MCFEEGEGDLGFMLLKRSTDSVCWGRFLRCVCVGCGKGLFL